MGMTIEEHIEALKSYHHGFTGCAGNLQDSIDVAVDIMSKYQKIQKYEDKESRWISVSEKLPEIENGSDNYLVTLKSDGVRIETFIECCGKHWWAHYDDDDVVAWMPLPQPYGEEETNE